MKDPIVNEILILKKVEHPSIIKLHKMLKSSNNVYLIYESVSFPRVKEILNNRNYQSFTVSELKDFTV